jgi:hypothetical protein
MPTIRETIIGDVAAAVTIVSLSRSDTGLTQGGITFPLAMTSVGGGAWSVSFADPNPPSRYNYQYVVSWPDSTASGPFAGVLSVAPILPPSPQLSRFPVFEYVPTLCDAAKATVRVLSIVGLSTKHDAVTSDRGRLYGAISGGNTLNLYADALQGGSSLVLTGVAAAIGSIFPLTAANGSGMSGRAIIDAYSGDDASIVVLPTFATDPDVRREVHTAQQLPAYHAAWGLAYFHADAMRTILTSALPAELPHLYGKTGLSAFVPQASAATLPDLRLLANADQLRLAQANLTEALSCKQSIHIPSFRDMYNEAMARFDAGMAALKAANVQEQVAAVAEQAEDLSGISVSSFSRF